ncbi:sensor histidine kinase KdpD [Herbaspirillum sp. SJZ107]|uniref:sensor histidine kinase n=1 Tax=Herbaspirillum sp. SJZ107 TaxID=2572881 RepID=UPI00114F0600|nr:HAMP domain-containing sensor histidine kinase [Herbaspirillum sp. SJZ107]TQK10272.1 signal transduction histidine kinase [Herbaspirillum sp. SJZ107]
MNKDSSRFEQLVAIRDEVVTRWLAQVKEQIPYAGNVGRRALINTLPDFYEHVVLTIVGEEEAFDHSTIAAEHGGQRARVTRFNAGDIGHEFQLFRSAIIDTWHANGITLNLDEVGRLNNEIDLALRESLIGFSKSQDQIREQFFSALTHDMRTPLAAASAAVGIIHKTDDLARTRQMAEIAIRQHATLASMIGDLLDMMVFHAGPTTLEVTDTALYDIVAEAVADVALSSGREIRFRGVQVNGRWYAMAIRRAVDNLLNNAVKYSTRDTPLDVSIGVKNCCAIVAISNQGPPIPEDHTEAIFQLFRRLRTDKGGGIVGWGIGLPYVRTVAEQHGGSITVDSNASGTTFFFSIPMDRI